MKENAFCKVNGSILEKPIFLLHKIYNSEIITRCSESANKSLRKGDNIEQKSVKRSRKGSPAAVS